MADFEAPSFSLGLDCDLSDSEPQISSVSEDEDYKTLIVDDSEPEYSDPPPKPKRLRHVLTTDVTTSSTVTANPKVELNSREVVDDEDVFYLQADRRADEHLHAHNHALSTSSKLPNTPGVLTKQPGKKSQTVGQRRRLLLSVSDSDSDDPSVSDNVNNIKCNIPESIDLSTTESSLEDFKSKKNSLNFDESLPPALRYFFHDDIRIQELVQSRLPNFSPLCNISNRDHEQPSTSEIDYMGQFSCSKEAVRNIKHKKRSSSSKISRKETIEETSQGWVNPKLCVNKEITKGTPKRKFHSVPKTAGYWLTGPDGKRVYVGKKGQELTGRVAYMQYKKESGTGFKKAKRKFATKKKK
ncbi:hypothetical protein L2E82_26008 [Cichorium intybus]|uniref:Uncharacterized protein n=1 Tax=Cichorium intybus TaxID=13427 RepID=A0ACB9E5P8_CICIN|nr:hypothetical protein L2E82_26008 [Cichorium intybus]